MMVSTLKHTQLVTYVGYCNQVLFLIIYLHSLTTVFEYIRTWQPYFVQQIVWID